MFLIALFIAVTYLLVSVIIDIHWFLEISSLFGTVFAFYLITFVALVPGFIFMFVVTSLIINKKKKSEELKTYPAVTILIPAFNSGLTVLKTIKAVLHQKYPGKLFIKVIDDGSNDKTVKFLRMSYVYPYIELITAPHKGKFNALNIGLSTTTTEYVISIDSDTYLLKNALKEIIKEIVNSDYVAVAGCLLVKNSKENLITKIQEWDYTIGIFGIKLLQSYYQSILVAQGAFSIYRTDILKLLGGWTNHLGEDIILTWRMLELGCKTGFSGTALAYTDVPETYKKLGIQRKRWARGMVEAFKELKYFFVSKADIKTKFLVSLNLFFPFADLAVLMFFPLGIILLIKGNYLLMGILTLVMLPFGLILPIVIEHKMRRNLHIINYKPEKRSKLALLIYILFYNFILAPYCLGGYISEILNLSKSWSGSKKGKEVKLCSKK